MSEDEVDAGDGGGLVVDGDSEGERGGGFRERGDGFGERVGPEGVVAGGVKVVWVAEKACVQGGRRVVEDEAVGEGGGDASVGFVEGVGDDRRGGVGDEEDGWVAVGDVGDSGHGNGGQGGGGLGLLWWRSFLLAFLFLERY